MKTLIHPSILRPMTLRIPTIIALLLCAVAGAYAQTSIKYKLEQVTSVEAGGLYVFEQTYNGTSYVMSNALSSKAVTTTTSYKTSGLTGTEKYIWALETAKGGFYMKNVSLSSSSYLNNSSSTDMAFGSKNSIWAFNFQSDNTVMIQNTSNGNRFLGFGQSGGVVTKYKAYEPGTINEPKYYHAIKVYQLVEETSATVSLNASGYATFASTSTLDFSDSETNGYTAWQITGISGTEITFQQITGAVATGTGVFLKGTAGSSIEIPYATSAGETLSGNKLVGITSATDVTADTYYGLKGSEFVKVNAGTVPAGKALLKAADIPSSVKSLSFVFDDNADHIGLTPEEVKNEGMNSEKSAGAVYDLSGKRIANNLSARQLVNSLTLQKGIYIHNGRKFVVR